MPTVTSRARAKLALYGLSIAVVFVASCNWDADSPGCPPFARVCDKTFDRAVRESVGRSPNGSSTPIISSVLSLFGHIPPSVPA